MTNRKESYYEFVSVSSVPEHPFDFSSLQYKLFEMEVCRGGRRLMGARYFGTFLAKEKRKMQNLQSKWQSIRDGSASPDDVKLDWKLWTKSDIRGLPLE